MFLLALLMQATPPADSPPLPPLHGGPAEMTCPVGGAPFSTWRPTMYSTYGERPDGKPYSYLPFPFPIPECPDNKLVVFDTFTQAEVTKLTTLIRSDAYRRLVAEETPHYRGYWLAIRLGRPWPTALGLLLDAIWSVSPGQLAPAQTAARGMKFRRYQETFVLDVERHAAAVAPEERIWILSRAANAARQLGRFAGAERLRRQALIVLGGLAEKKGWDRYLLNLGPVIARGDRDVEPLDMIPERELAAACARRETMSVFDRAYCARPDVAPHVAEHRHKP